MHVIRQASCAVYAFVTDKRKNLHRMSHPLRDIWVSVLPGVQMRSLWLQMALMTHRMLKM